MIYGNCENCDDCFESGAVCAGCFRSVQRRLWEAEEKLDKVIALLVPKPIPERALKTFADLEREEREYNNGCTEPVVQTPTPIVSLCEKSYPLLAMILDKCRIEDTAEPGGSRKIEISCPGDYYLEQLQSNSYSKRLKELLERSYGAPVELRLSRA